MRPRRGVGQIAASYSVLKWCSTQRIRIGGEFFVEADAPEHIQDVSGTEEICPGIGTATFGSLQHLLNRITAVEILSLGMVEQDAHHTPDFAAVPVPAAEFEP